MIARGLGLFSIALGTAQLIAPEQISRLIGVRGHASLMRAMGLREVGTGIGLLTQKRPAEWLWARVGGDLIDLAALGSTMASKHTDRERAGRALAAVAGITVLDYLISEQLSRTRVRAHDGVRKGADPDALNARGIHVRNSVTINKPASALYRFWRAFENLPRFMKHLHSVHNTGTNRSHWVASAPAGTSVEWDAEIINDSPDELIAWRSLDGGSVDHAGSVRFRPAPGGRGTEVRVELQYNPPAGRIGAAVARLFGEAPQQQIADDLRRFKQVMETGEVTSNEGPRGSCRM